MKTVEQYKKGVSLHPVTALKYLALTLAGFSCILPFVWVALSSVKPVSYTHLTLPTIYSV